MVTLGPHDFYWVSVFLNPRTFQRKPVEVMRSELNHGRTVADRRKFRFAEELEWNQALIFGEVELGELCEARKVGDHQDRVATIFPDECQNAWIRWTEKFGRPAPKGWKALAQRNEALGPPQERCRILLLVLNVERFVVVFRVNDHRQDEALRVRA